MYTGSVFKVFCDLLPIKDQYTYFICLYRINMNISQVKRGHGWKS